MQRSVFGWLENWERLKDCLGRLDFQIQLGKVQAQKANSVQIEGHESK